MTIAWTGEEHYIELGDFVREVTASTILRSTPQIVWHNFKFDARMLLNAGCISREWLTCTGFHDTETLAQLLDENRPKGLKPLSELVLGRTTDEAEVLKVVRRKLKLKKDDGYHLLPRSVLIPYAITDARFTFDLYQVFSKQMAEKPAQLQEKYLEELKLTLALLDMEIAGIATRPEYVESTVKEYGLKILTLQRDIGKLVDIEDFNPNSPKQIMEAFVQRGITLVSTGVEVLEKVSDPLAEMILELRKYSKLRQTYLIPLQTETVDGILHPSLRQHGTRTGRMSSGEASNN